MEMNIMTYPKALSKNDQRRLDELYSHLQAASKTFAGYPCNTSFDYSELFRFLEFVINNIGDPFSYSNYQVNTHEFEQEVIGFFADLLQAGNYFRGYVCNGGTEGNLFGIDLGLQRFPDAVLYYSVRAHYSIDKISRLLRVPVERIPALANGEIDYTVLRQRIAKNKDKSVVICANIGTTMTGAVDDINKIQTILAELKIKKFHLHGDAALSGMILPFVKDPQPFNFADGIHSIAISGHKFIGSPLACGIVLTNQEPIKAHQPIIAYVKITDNTISGSRSGLTTLILWYAIKRHGKQGFKQLVERCFQHIEYGLEAFEKAGIAAWRNKNSITLVFPRPAETLIKKWQLAPYENIVHMMMMPHVNKDFVDEFLQDLLNSNTKGKKSNEKINC